MACSSRDNKSTLNSSTVTVCSRTLTSSSSHRQVLKRRLRAMTLWMTSSTMMETRRRVIQKRSFPGSYQRVSKQPRLSPAMLSNSSDSTRTKARSMIDRGIGNKTTRLVLARSRTMTMILSLSGTVLILKRRLATSLVERSPMKLRSGISSIPR